MSIIYEMVTPLYNELLIFIILEQMVSGEQWRQGVCADESWQQVFLGICISIFCLFCNCVNENGIFLARPSKGAWEQMSDKAQWRGQTEGGTDEGSRKGVKWDAAAPSEKLNWISFIIWNVFLP